MPTWALRAAIALALAAAAAALVFGVQRAYEHWRGQVLQEGDRAGAARVKAQWDEDRAKAQTAAVEAARLAAEETQRRLNAQQENDRAQQARLAQLRRDNERLAGAADGLRLRAAAYLDAAGCGAVTGDSAVECLRKAAAAVGDALGRSGEIARRAAAAADEARDRGLRCEADYDALTLKATTSTASP